jgi:hypothetical protein
MMFGLNRKHKVIRELVHARKSYDAAMLAFLHTFKGHSKSLGEELARLPDADLAEFLMSVCEMKALATIPCRCRSEINEMLLSECEDVLSKATASLTSTDLLGMIASYESLPETVKAAARDRVQALLEQQRREREAAKARAEEPDPEPEEDYGRGRYCTGCGGC